MLTPLSRRGPRTALGLTAMSLMLAAFAPSGFAATSIDLGSPAGVTPCSDVESVETICLLPFGEPLSQSGAVSSLSVGDADPVLLIARPKPGTPGTFSVIRPSKSPLSWKVRGGSTVIDTAIRVLAGDQLVLADPLVTTTASSVDFEAPLDLSELTTGQQVGVRPVGRITIDPDADGDGYGDETSDECPGVLGRRCAPGALTVALSGPAYTPSESTLEWTWTATNVGETAQPFVVNVFSGEAVPTVTGPPGSACAPGAATTAAEVLLPAAQRSPLTQVGTLPPGVGGRSHPADPGLRASGWSHCRLPVLAPGQSASGTVGGTGGMSGYYSLAVSGLPALSDSDSFAKSLLFTKTTAWHLAPGKELAAWRPGSLTPATISVTGRMLVGALCNGPAEAATCTVTGSVTTPIGAIPLGTVAVPVVGKPRTAVSPVITFSKKGLLWLATHRRSQVDLSITTAWPGETAATTTLRFRPARSAALKRKLAKLIKPKRKTKK